MGKTSSAVKNRYNLKTYDRLNILVPKGRKKVIEARAEAIADKSVNGYVNGLIRADLGLTEDEWKGKDNEG